MGIWEESAFQEIMRIIELLRKALPGEILNEKESRTLPLLHQLPQLEYWAECTGPNGETIDGWSLRWEMWEPGGIFYREPGQYETPLEKGWSKK